LRRETSTEAQRTAFWNKIVFYNFAVDPVVTRADRPSDAHFRAAEEPLREVLKEHGPEGVLILGKGQEIRSGAVISSLGISYESCPHPTAYGVRTEVLTAAWQKLHEALGA
jgi:hypothetical protein